MSGKSENAGRPAKERLNPKDVLFIKAKIKKSEFASLAMFYEHAYSAAKSPKYRDYPQPSDVSTVTEAYKSAFAGRRPLPKLYSKILEELLSITSDSLPSQVDSLKKHPIYCEDKLPDFTPKQLVDGDNTAWNKAYKCFYNTAFITLQPCIKLLSTEKLKEVATQAVNRLILECVNQATSCEELKESSRRLSREGVLQVLGRKDTNINSGLSNETSISKQLAADLHRDLERREREVRLAEALDRFSTQCRTVVVDYYSFHLTEEEIVKKRNLAIETVRSFIEQSRLEFAGIYRM